MKYSCVAGGRVWSWPEVLEFKEEVGVFPVAVEEEEGSAIAGWLVVKERGKRY